MEMTLLRKKRKADEGRVGEKECCSMKEVESMFRCTNVIW
jgi:hypothetical protein